MGIDTWAVDYVLLDKEDKILGKLTDIETAEPQEWIQSI